MIAMMGGAQRSNRRLCDHCERELTYRKERKDVIYKNYQLRITPKKREVTAELSARPPSENFFNSASHALSNQMQIISVATNFQIRCKTGSESLE
jgi:hypothetical protein